MMNCREVLSLLYDVIDNEASEDDVKQVELHLAGCSNCFEIFRIEDAVHEFLVSRLRNNGPSGRRVKDLKSRVLATLDKIDQVAGLESGAPPSTGPFDL